MKETNRSFKSLSYPIKILIIFGSLVIATMPIEIYLSSKHISDDTSNIKAMSERNSNQLKKIDRWKRSRND